MDAGKSKPRNISVSHRNKWILKEQGTKEMKDKINEMAANSTLEYDEIAKDLQPEINSPCIFCNQKKGIYNIVSQLNPPLYFCYCCDCWPIFLKLDKNLEGSLKMIGVCCICMTIFPSHHHIPSCCGEGFLIFSPEMVRIATPEEIKEYGSSKVVNNIFVYENTPNKKNHSKRK